MCGEVQVSQCVGRCMEACNVWGGASTISPAPLGAPAPPAAEEGGAAEERPPGRRVEVI